MSLHSISEDIKLFFEKISNVRPIIWIGLYIALVPIFAFAYWLLPDGQFRVPDNAGTDFGSWLYYSIVTITTLGFGDYTPAGTGAQTITAIEVMCGLVFLGFFLNAVGAMKSEIAVETELEKQRRLHFEGEKDKLLKNTPIILHQLNLFLSFCYAITTPRKKRQEGSDSYNPDFKFSDLTDLYKPSGLPLDHSTLPGVTRFIKCADRTSLLLDSIQEKIDLSLWPSLLEDCFSFVADYQLLSSIDRIADKANILHSSRNLDDENVISQKIASSTTIPNKDDIALEPYVELYNYIKKSGKLALNIESVLTEISAK